MLAGSESDHCEGYCEHRDSCLRTPTRVPLPLRAVEHSPDPRPSLPHDRRSGPSLRPMTINHSNRIVFKIRLRWWRLMLMIKARSATLVTPIGMHDGEGCKA